VEQAVGNAIDSAKGKAAAKKIPTQEMGKSDKKESKAAKKAGCDDTGD